MTQPNIFREIDEEMEQQRLEELWKRYGSYVVLFFLAIIGGTAINTYWQGHRVSLDQKATAELIALQNEKGDTDKRIANLLNFAAENKGVSQAAFAELHAAAFAAQKGDRDKAVKIYDALAADATADHAFRQLADILSVEQQLDAGDPAALTQRLQPLMAAGEPWRNQARELAGFLAVHGGDKARASEMFTALTQDASVPASMNARATDMLRLLAQ